jgi:hypothetical protein
MAKIITIELEAKTKDAQKQLELVTKEIQEQKEITIEFEKELTKLEQQLKATPKGAIQQQKALKNEISNLKDAIKDQRVSLKELNLERQNAVGVNRELNKKLKEAKDQQKGLGKFTAILDKQTGGVIGKFTGFTSALSAATKGMKLFRAALISTGIGALVVAVGSLIAAFKNSEEGQNRFAKVMTQIGVVVGNTKDILENFGKAIISVFTGNFKAAREALKEATDGVKNFREETQKEIKLAGELADKRAKADILQRELITKRAEADRKRNEALEKATNREDYTAEQRIKFLREAAAIDQEITDQELAAAKLRLEAMETEMQFNESTKEDLEAEQKLRAEVINLESRRLKRARTLTQQISQFRREAQAEEEKEQREKDKQKEQADKEELRKEKELADLKKQIRDALAVTEDQQRELELIKVGEHYEALIEKAKQNNLDTIELERQKEAAIAATQQEFNAKDEAARKKKADEDKKAKDTEQKLNEDVERAKLQAAGQTFGAIAQLAGEGSKVGKAAAIAQATISSIEGTQNAFTTAAKSPITTVFPAYPYIQAGVAAAAGLANIKAIKSTKVGTTTAPTTPTATGGGRGAASTPSIPPAFNIVGASDTNQLAEAIGGQAQQPVKAYVVSNDVSTAQELDRNIVEGASIG